MGGAPRLFASRSGRLRFVAPSSVDPPADSPTRPSCQQSVNPQNSTTTQSRPARKARAAGGPATRLLGEAAPASYLPGAADHSTTSASKRSVVGARRRNVAGAHGLSDRYLADKRLTARTVASYGDAHSDFLHWAQQNKVSTSPAHLDRSLRKYLQTLFFAGAPPYDARQVVHGTIFCRELLKSPNTLPLAKATLAGFTTSSPEHARDPMPEESWYMLMSQLNHVGGDGKHAANALAVSFDGMFRPSEVLSLTSVDVHVLTGRKRRLDLPPVSVTLRPLGDHAPGYEPPPRTKAGEHDDSVCFGDNAPGSRAWIALLLAKLAKRRRGLLFPISLNRYEQLTRQAVEQCGFQKMRLTPHCARHGAASVAYATKTLDLKSIQKRGRWKSASSVRTYEKSAKLVRQLAKMTYSQRREANSLTATLPSLLLSEV